MTLDPPQDNMEEVIISGGKKGATLSGEVMESFEKIHDLEG